ncbi:hypothetical protein L210DRAFT_819171, partial [Boletus edulis BED1]
QQLGPIALIHLIQKLMLIRCRKADRLVTTSMEIADAMDRVYAMGLPSKETFCLIVMLNGLSDELPGVRDHIADCITRSSPRDPYTPALARLRLDTEQQLLDVAKQTLSSIALAATVACTSSSRDVGSRAVSCGNCGQSGHAKCCLNPHCTGRRVGHTTDECVSHGGGREGQHEAVFAEQAAAHAARRGKGAASAAPPALPSLGDGPTPPSSTRVSAPTPRTGNIRYAAGGRAFFVDPVTHNAYLLHDVPVPAPTGTTEFAGLASDPIPLSVLSAIASSDFDEYDTLFLDSGRLETSVNWSSVTVPTDVAALTYRAPSQHAPTIVDPSIMPFYLDSGASVHISNCESDFFHLCPISPRVVHGVGGSSVQAVGLGTIKLV